MQYVIDSCCLIHMTEQGHYAKSVFRRFWKNVEGMVATGKIIIPQEVVTEIMRKDDVASEWVKNKGFKPKHDIREKTEKLIKKITEYEQAPTDIHIIALAQALTLTVITEEKMKGKNKIPSICEKLQVPCVNLVGLMRQEKLFY